MVSTKKTMENLCSLCKKPDTKYHCVKCRVRVCNICAISVSANTVGYSEENYSVGICPECNNIEKQKIEKDEVEIIDVKTFAPTAPKKQKTMFSALGMTDRPAFSKATKTIIMPKKKVNNPKLCSGKAPKPVSTPSRTVKSETIEKWKTELADFNVNEWLFYKTDAKGVPVSIHCKFCIQYEENIKHVDGFTNQFIVGSTNFRKSNV